MQAKSEGEAPSQDAAEEHVCIWCILAVQHCFDRIVHNTSNGSNLSARDALLEVLKVLEARPLAHKTPSVPLIVLSSCRV